MFENFTSGKNCPFYWNIVKFLCKDTTWGKEFTIFELKPGAEKLFCEELKLICEVWGDEDFWVKPIIFESKVKLLGGSLRVLTFFYQ